MNRRNVLELVVCGALYCLGVRPSPQPTMFRGGIIEYIRTEVSPTAGSLTGDALLAEVERVFKYGAGNKLILFSSPEAAERFVERFTQ